MLNRMYEEETGKEVPEEFKNKITEGK